MAFQTSMEMRTPDSGKLRGKQMQIACECWFTSTGDTKPIMIKFMDREGKVQTIRHIEVCSVEEKYYAGIPSKEYICNIYHEGIEKQVRLNFFQEECRWTMEF